MRDRWAELVRRLLLALAMLFVGLALIYWGWQPSGREEAAALGMVLVILTVPVLLYAVP